MKPICDILEQRVSTAMAEITADDSVLAAVVKPSQNPQFGDYQANGVMGLAKRLKANPRELAEKVVAKLDVADMCEPPEVAGPGFINFRLRADWLAARLLEAANDDRLGITPVAGPKTVVDFSGPNIAKQMHVGHLRSTIIGDVIARVLEFWYGNPNNVIRQNHIGDWGLQMGMLLAIEEELEKNKENLIRALKEDDSDYVEFVPLEKIEEAYKQANKRFNEDPEFAARARNLTYKLQSTKAGWAYTEWFGLRHLTLSECQRIYERMNVILRPENVRGESFYNDKLPDVIKALQENPNVDCHESDGAQCVFLEGFKNKDGESLPMIVQKSDGAYLYATTDLAAIRYRIDELHAKRVIYVTDLRQKLHFQMLFACVRQAGWAGEDVTLDHVPFGTVLGEDNKPFKTRSGENVKLKDLLDEAVTRARKVVEEKNPDLSDEEKQQVAQAVGIGAVKYADLSNDLVKDYVFSWDRMLSLEGNTAPYLQYAFARIRSIFRKGEVDEAKLLSDVKYLALTEPDELALAKRLLRYGEVVETVARDLRPHVLTTYLFELSQAFSGFYTNCPVLQAPPEVRPTRLMLCLLTARTISHGLGLLGIQTPQRL
ncbi:MAG: arginine--tRNA ligase [Sedimentisphaerales bacterium]|nr:arginine--tRNA ligase [Sedimentisphaerales bacterium]